MSINLSDLTSPNNQDVLAEITSGADFLDPIGKLENLSRGSNAGGHALQTTALLQPKALPYDGKGYLYVSGVSGNYASVPNATNLNGITDFVMEAKDVYMGDWAASGAETFLAKYNTGQNGFVFARLQGTISFYAQYSGSGSGPTFAHGLTGAKTANIKLIRSGTSLTAQIDTGAGYVTIGSTATVPSGAIDTTTTPIEIGSYNGGGIDRLTGKIGQIRLWKNATASGTPVLDVDFTATNIRHGDTKFKCATGQVVTINSSGLDPAKIIKRPVLRFDGADDFLSGVFGQTITEGYMFAAFSVLGDGGESHGRIFSMNSTGAADNAAGGFAIYRNALTNGYRSNYNGNTLFPAPGLFGDSMGDVLFESSFKNSSQFSMVNNADKNNGTGTFSGVLSSEEFKISAFTTGGYNTAIDLEFLALFSADSVPDEATAKRIRDYINGRGSHPIFSLIDSAGYYFYNAQKAPVGAISSGSSAWNGRIVGSDNGDADKLATQATANDQPVGDGFKVTFADNSDHLDIPSTTQAGWQIVGTSLGTFAYRVDNDAVTELNLLGNLGVAAYRRTGDLYGVMLLPDSASSSDIESARKLLIDRGSLDGSLSASYFAAWIGRNDIVEFKSVDLSSPTSVESAWQSCGSLTTFPALNLSSATNVAYAWFLCSSLNNFGAIDARNASIFLNTWRGCTALTSFPAGAKLGTEATNVNFESAWRDSGLTSFPALDLSKGNNFNFAFNGCSSLTSFPGGAKLGTAASNVQFLDTWKLSGLTSFPADIDLSKGTYFRSAWRQSALTSFPAIESLKNGGNFSNGWLSCTSLTDFAAVFTNWNPTSIASGVFDGAWGGCSALSAQSVENILTSIDASGKYATTNGASGGTALGDAGIDIDYNTATGTPAYSTLASLKSKGWVIKVNNVTL
jgi:hypothetical protein